MAATTKFRLSIDFRTLDDLREFAEIMEDRIATPEDAHVREMDVLDERGGGIAKFIWALRTRGHETPGEEVYPNLSPEWERRALKARLAYLEEGR